MSCADYILRFLDLFQLFSGMKVNVYTIFIIYTFELEYFHNSWQYFNVYANKEIM